MHRRLRGRDSKDFGELVATCKRVHWVEREFLSSRSYRWQIRFELQIIIALLASSVVIFIYTCNGRWIFGWEWPIHQQLQENIHNKFTLLRWDRFQTRCCCCSAPSNILGYFLLFSFDFLTFTWRSSSIKWPSSVRRYWRWPIHLMYSKEPAIKGFLERENERSNDETLPV